MLYILVTAILGYDSVELTSVQKCYELRKKWMSPIYLELLLLKESKTPIFRKVIISWLVILSSKFAIPPVFDGVSIFHEGLAAVLVDVEVE